MGGSVLGGALTLLGAGLVSRILGFFYRIFLSRTLGAEGMGLLGMIFPILGVAITLASAGLPVALAKIVAERHATGRRPTGEALRVSLGLVVATSIPLAVGLFALAPFVTSRILPDSRSLYPLLALVPLLPMVAIGSVLRGYLQGLKRMGSLGLAQIAEQVVRIAVALYLVRLFLTRGLVWGTVGAAWGIVIGELFGVIILILAVRRLHPGPRSLTAAGWTGTRETLVEILSLAMPVTATRLLGSLTDLLDAAVVPRGLIAFGLSRAAATSFYGQLTGMAFPLILFPSVISGALNGALIPAISEAAAQGDFAMVRRRSEKALRFTLLYTLPFSAALLTLGAPLARHLYGIAGVGSLIPPLALVSPLLYLEFTLAAILRGLGRPLVPMRNGLLGSAIRLGLIIFLTPRPGFGPRAILIGIAADLALCLILNYRSLQRIIPVAIDLKEGLFLPFLGALGLGVFGLQAYPFLQALGSSVPVSLVLSLLGGGLLYLLFLFGTGTWPRGLAR